MRAYLTPEAAAGEYLCRRLLIPVEMASIVTGALETLTHEWSYEQFGTMSVTDAALLMTVMFNDYLGQGCSMWIGMTAYFPKTEPPSADWLPCDGAPYDKADYPELWAYLSPDYEYSPTQFRTPEMQERVIRGGFESLGELGGEEQHTITVEEMPAHGHGTHSHGVLDPGIVDVGTNPPAFIYAQSEVGLPGSTDAASVPETGGDQPFSLWPPYIFLAPFILAKSPAVPGADFTWAYPKTSVLWWRDAYTNAGGITLAVMASQQFNHYGQFTGAPVVGSYGEIGFHLQAGSYVLKALGLTHPAAPIVSWLLDGASVVASDDWYSAAQVSNVERSFNITVASSGYHVLRVEVIGKHASSSNRQMRLTRVAILPESY